MFNKSNSLSFLVWTLLSLLISADLMALDADVKLVDPTRPPGAKEAARVGDVKHSQYQAPKWVLSSILIGSERRMARINGRMLQVGEQVNGATVDAIHANEVWLKSKQKRFKISLLAAKIKEISRHADK